MEKWQRTAQRHRIARIVLVEIRHDSSSPRRPRFLLLDVTTDWLEVNNRYVDSGYGRCIGLIDLNLIVGHYRPGERQPDNFQFVHNFVQIARHKR